MRNAFCILTGIAVLAACTPSGSGRSTSAESSSPKSGVEISGSARFGVVVVQ